MPRESIHVWSFDLDAEPASLLLSDDERERASRFHFPVHRDRFVACRSMLRRILGDWLNVRPSDLAFEYGAFGKPLLRGAPKPHFNVTHSDYRAMIAVCDDAPVGIDIERTRELDDLPALALIVFNEHERLQMSALDRFDRSRAFFRGWCRKEAYFKATGAGLSAELHAVTVDLTEQARGILDIRDDDRCRWSMHDVAAPDGFVAAVAVPRAHTVLVVCENSAEAGSLDNRRSRCKRRRRLAPELGPTADGA